MQVSKQQIKYHLTHFRTRKSYLIFQICQLILSIVIIITAFISPHLFRQPIVLQMQLFLLICMTIDLFVIRLFSQGSLCKNRTNKIDTLIYIIFLSTFLFMWISQAKTKQGQSQSSSRQQIIQADDIIVITIIICRYMIQIYQIVNQIQDTQNNMQCQTSINNFDMNVSPYTSVTDEVDVMQDQIIRERIKAKKSVIENKIQLVSSNGFQ